MGTLTLLKSQGVHYGKWMLGKWLALLAPVLGITLILFLLAGSLLANMDDFGIFNWSSLWMLFLVYVIYYIVFGNIVLFISALFKKSGIALVASLCVWILACLATPKAASNIAETKHPYPTRQEFMAKVLKDKKQGLDGHDPWSKEAKKLEKEVLAEYGVDSLHQLPFNFAAYRTQKGEEHEAEVYFKHYNYLKEQYGNQSQIYRGLAVISPYLPTRFLSMAIAHTDYDTHWDFADAAEAYRIELQAFLNNNTAENTKYGERGYTASADFWKQLPVFEYNPPELGAVLANNTSNLLILALWSIGSFLLLFFTVKTI